MWRLKGALLHPRLWVRDEVGRIHRYAFVISPLSVQGCVLTTKRRSSEYSAPAIALVFLLFTLFTRALFTAGTAEDIVNSAVQRQARRGVFFLAVRLLEDDEMRVPPTMLEGGCSSKYKTSEIKGPAFLATLCV